MPTKRIGDIPEQSVSYIKDRSQRCLDLDHNPAGLISREDGVYEHTCPGCGKVQKFTVNKNHTLWSE